MFPLIIQFANLLLAALVVGAMFGTWLIFNPSGMPAGLYVTIHQQGIRTLNKAMPILGAATILITIAAVVFRKTSGTSFALLIATLICFIVAGLVTRFLNQPINAIVATWSSSAPPTNWTQLRDAWWRWHLLRLAAGLLGLCTLIAATLHHP